MIGHEMYVRHPVLFNESERLLRIPAVHHHDADPPEEWKPERERQWCRVVQRACAQVKVAVVVYVAASFCTRRGAGFRR